MVVSIGLRAKTIPRAENGLLSDYAALALTKLLDLPACGSELAQE